MYICINISYILKIFVLKTNKKKTKRFVTSGASGVVGTVPAWQPSTPKHRMLMQGFPLSWASQRAAAPPPASCSCHLCVHVS